MFKYNLYTLVNHSISISSKLANCQYHFPPRNTKTRITNRNCHAHIRNHRQKGQSHNPARALVSQSWIENWIVWEANLSTNCLKKQLWERFFLLQKTYKLNLPSIWSCSETRREIKPEHLKIFGGKKEMSIFVLSTNAKMVLCP